MLRPTESKILFLQQLGRGLRLHHQKTHLVVIDFIGNHKSFLIKPVALHNGHSFKQLAKQIIPIPPSKYELRSHFEQLDLRWNSSQ